MGGRTRALRMRIGGVSSRGHSECQRGLHISYYCKQSRVSCDRPESGEDASECIREILNTERGLSIEMVALEEPFKQVPTHL